MEYDAYIRKVKVLDELENYKEVNLFLRGMIPLVGFRSSSVYYERKPRISGKTHYSLNKMFALAFNTDGFYLIILFLYLYYYVIE